MVLIYLLSKPEGWTVRNSDLVNQSPAGREKVYAILKELAQNQYLYRWKKNGKSGRIEWKSEVSECPEEMAEWVEQQGFDAHHNVTTVYSESAAHHNVTIVNG